MKKEKSIPFKTDKIIPLFVLALLIVLWHLAWKLEWIPRYMLPSPFEVVEAFINDFPLLMEHARTTLIEAGLGLLIGTTLGFICAALMDSFKIIRQGLYPILVITQTIPTVAIAPLLILWFSYGIAPKVILVVLVTFFPISVGLLEGFMSVDSDMISLMKSMKASRWQIFWHVKFPNALGEFFSGLKIAVTYSVVGAVISEWLGGLSGLGVYMTRVKKSLSYDKMFAVIIFISIISLVLMTLVRVMQIKMMPWKNVEENK